MRLLHKNSLSGATQLGLTACLTFFSIPIFIKALGTEAYGAFSIVTLAGNLNIFSNLGLNTALLKFLSVQGKSKESDHDIIVTISLLCIIMIPLSLVAIYFQENILQGGLGLSDKLYAQVNSMYRYVVIANLVIMLGQTFTTILDSQQKMYLTNFYQFVYSILYWGGLIAVVILGYGMTEIGVAILMSSCIWILLVSISAWRSWGNLHTSGIFQEARRIAKKQLTFGANVYVAGVLSMLFEPMTKILVSRLIGVSEVGYLEIAYKIRSQLWSLTTKMVYPFFPKIARETDIDKLSMLVRSLQIIMLRFITPFLAFFALLLPYILCFWLPNVNPVITIATLSITSAYLLGTIALPSYYFLMSRQHVRKTVWLQLTNVSVNGIVILLTYKWLGMYGIILANSLAILSSLVLSFYYQRVYLGKIRMKNIYSKRTITVLIGVVSITYSFESNSSDPALNVSIVIIAALISYSLILWDSRLQFKTWIA